MTNTIDEFISSISEHQYDDSLIRKAIDKVAYWTDTINNEKEYHIIHLYLCFLSQKFNFEIDTDTDSR